MGNPQFYAEKIMGLFYGDNSSPAGGRDSEYVFKKIVDEALEKGDFSFRDRALVAKALRDLLWDRQEVGSRQKNFPGEVDLYPAVGEIVEAYNSLLKKNLLDSSTGLPYFLMANSSPGENFTGVNLPESLHWIFSGEKTDVAPFLWVNKKAYNHGIIFLKVISAACAGIENLLDIEKISQNPNIYIPPGLIDKYGSGESNRSKIRRLSVQTLLPIFSSGGFAFGLEDLLHHSLAFFQIFLIPAAGRLHSLACEEEDYRNLIMLFALALDRTGETQKALILLENTPFSEESEIFSFHRARLMGELGQFESAEVNMQQALSVNENREYYRNCLYRLMEEMPLENPFRNMGCPQILKIYHILTDEDITSEDSLFMSHIHSCPECGFCYQVVNSLLKPEEFYVTNG